MENVDLNEVAKFESISQAWWDSLGPFKTLHDINPHRVSFIESSLDIGHKRVLDVGCGGGILTEALSEKAKEIIGIDASSEAIATAKQHALQNKKAIEYLPLSVEAYSQQEPKPFDLITCMELLEHVPDPASTISHMARLLKPNGKLVLSTLNRNLKSFLLAIVGAEYCLGMLPKGTHDYSQFITPAELDEWCRAHDLNVECYRGLNYSPLTRTYRLSHDVSVNYLVSYTRHG